MKGFLFISNGTKTGIQVERLKEIDIDSFSLPAMDAADKMGYKLYLGYNVNHPELLMCNQYDITYYHQNIYRNIFALKDNYKAYRNLCLFLKGHEDIEVLHCNTPIGGVIGRLCGHKFKKKVFYTAHGFHFFKGAPLLNWLLFYPIERFLAHWTDTLITINSEDYQIAQSFKLHNKGNVYYVPGVGVDLSKYNVVTGVEKNIREELNLEKDAVVIVAVGRLDKNKNNSTIIKALAEMKNQKVHLLVCGEGDQRNKLEELILELNLQDRVHLLGNRTDVPEIYRSSDMFVLASYREGLSRSIMEGMASGLPCVVSNIRGNVDLVDEEGGYIVNPCESRKFSEAFDNLADKYLLRKQMGFYNKEKVKKFSLEASKEAFLKIYLKELGIYAG